MLESILVHPVTQQHLVINRKDQIIQMDEADDFKAGFDQGVPFLLPKHIVHFAGSQIHDRNHSLFNYQEHYTQDAEYFDYFQEFTSRADQAEKNRLNEMIIGKIPKNTTSVLDVGCGNGWLSRNLTSDTTTVISMDISSRNPVEALKRHPHPHHEALIADAYHLPLKENSLDCVVASEVMEHVSDPALFIEKLLLVLKPGGRLIITTPYDEQIQYHMCVHCNQPTPSHAHLHSFNEDNIAELIPLSVQSRDWCTFSNKYMNKMRAYLMMRKLPFSVWKLTDRLANKLWYKPMRLMIEIVK